MEGEPVIKQVEYNKWKKMRDDDDIDTEASG